MYRLNGPWYSVYCSVSILFHIQGRDTCHRRDMRFKKGRNDEWTLIYNNKEKFSPKLLIGCHLILFTVKTVDHNFNLYDCNCNLNGYSSGSVRKPRGAYFQGKVQQPFPLPRHVQSTCWRLSTAYVSSWRNVQTTSIYGSVSTRTSHGREQHWRREHDENFASRALVCIPTNSRLITLLKSLTIMKFSQTKLICLFGKLIQCHQKSPVRYGTYHRWIVAVMSRTQVSSHSSSVKVK